MLKLNIEDREALEWAKRKIGMPDLTDSEVLAVLRGTGQTLAGITGETYNPDKRRDEELHDLHEEKRNDDLGGILEALNPNAAREFRAQQQSLAERSTIFQLAGRFNQGPSDLTKLIQAKHKGGSNGKV